MTDGTGTAGAGDLVYDESYGPIARSATPGEHVYFTVVTLGRWLLALTAVAFVVFVSTMFQSDLRGEAVYRYLLLPSFGFLAVVIAVFGFLAVYARAALTITPTGITLRRRGLAFGRRRFGSWRLGDLVSVDVGTMMTFHVGGSTPQYHLVLRFSSGEAERFGGAFMSVPATQKVADAIWASVNRMTRTG
jgi:hypothetical protein